MVAFLQHLPQMTPQQYEDMVARAPPDEDMGGDEGDRHPGADGHEHSRDDRD